MIHVADVFYRNKAGMKTKAKLAHNFDAEPTLVGWHSGRPSWPPSSRDCFQKSLHVISHKSIEPSDF